MNVNIYIYRDCNNFLEVIKIENCPKINGGAHYSDGNSAVISGVPHRSASEKLLENTRFVSEKKYIRFIFDQW